MPAIIDPTTAFLLVVLGVVGLMSLALGLRNRLSFRIAMRNVRRGRWRTVLLVLGLLVGTTIISSSLVVGDTVDQLIVRSAYQVYGFTDEGVYNLTPLGAYAPFNASVYVALNRSLGSDPQVAGLTPEVIGQTAAYDLNSGVPQTALHLVGVNANQSAHLGPFVATTGGSVTGPSPGSVILDQGAANDLGATAGHHLILYVGGSTWNTTVQAVVADDSRGGFLGGGFAGSGTVFVDLATAQQLERIPGKVNFIAVTNAGSLTSGVALSGSVSAKLNASLAAIPGAAGLKVHQLLADTVNSAASAGSSLATLFLVFGLFSIAAGAMLIVGLFVMLAEERKGEMGMVRAIGLRRGQLVVSYYFEGLAYSAGSALLGVLIGIGVGYGLVYAFAQLFASVGLPPAQIFASFTIRPQSMLVAYVAGFLLTLATVVGTSARTSRLNIVRAIRSIPEPPPTMGVYTRLATGGTLVLAVGAFLLATTARGTSDISEPVIGGAMAILGAAMLASRFFRNRPVFSIAAVLLLLWAGLAPVGSWPLGTDHAGGFFLVFTEGILLVFGAILLYIFNSASVVAGVSRSMGSRPSSVSIARVGLSNPSRRPGRTAISLAIFALVVFTLVVIASFGATLAANVARTEAVQTGGYTFVGASQRPISDLPGRIANSSQLSGLYSRVVPLISGGVLEAVPGFTQDPFGDALYSAPANLSPTNDFYSTNSFEFQSTASGLSGSGVWSELRGNGAVAVVDASYGPSSGGQFGFAVAHPTVSAGETIVLTNPESGAREGVQVIGVMTEQLVPGIFVSPTAARVLGYSSESTFLLTTAPGVDATHAAQLTKAALLSYGLVLEDLPGLVAESLGFTQAFVGLLQLFVGLGLAVGIASLGILALRAVQERRSEIGMLRAVGFTESMIFRSFLLEFSFVTLLGIAIGTVLGILLIYGLAAAPGSGAAGITVVAIPWLNVALIALLAYGLTILAVLGPSLRASRLPPAEAVRPTE